MGGKPVMVLGKSDNKDARLSIFDQSGWLVKEYITTDFNNNISFTWDGRDQLGNKVKNGVYYYTISAGEGMSHGRIILVK